MFLGFLVFLRRGGIKVSLHDWLSLMEGLSMGLHGQSFRGFYVLSRALLVKTESDLDKYEELFCRYFRNVDSDAFKEEISVIKEQPELVKNALAGYIQKNKPDAAFVSDRIDELLALYDEENSEIQAFGAGEIMSKANSAGQGAGPGSGSGPMMQGAGGKSIVHARGDRRFRDWRTDCTIESRQFQIAFRLLRELSRKLDSSDEELDIRGTVDGTCRQAGILDIKMQPPRKNRLKLMVLIDSGGSMKPYEELCSLLFQSLNKANTFSDLKIYYFHNCLEDKLDRDPSINPADTIKTDWVIRNISKEYKVIFVGDADMAMHELMDGSQSSWSVSESNDGITWFKKFRERYRHSIWLHPQEREKNIAWMPESFAEIEKVFPMFRLSIDGLKDGMYRLLRG